MVAFEEIIRSTVETLDILGVVLTASGVLDDFYYEKTFGVRSLKEGQPPEPMNVNDVFYTASYTNIMTAISVLQCVEQGFFTLDEDVTRLLPKLEDIEVLKGFEEETDKPVLVKARKKITLRHLLSHSSGLEYDFLNPSLTRWRRSRGEPAGMSPKCLHYRCTAPLLFEPGEKYAYPTGFEWAGFMVERATGTGLEEYMKANIWKPLGITSITFHPEKHPDIMSSILDMSVRLGGTNQFGTSTDPLGKVAWRAGYWTSRENDDSGGAGVFGLATNYIKILHCISAGDGKLLKQESVDELFKPQLSDSSRAHLIGLIKCKGAHGSLAFTLPLGTEISHGLAGVVCLENIGGRQRSGTMLWQGLLKFLNFLCMIEF